MFAILNHYILESHATQYMLTPTNLCMPKTLSKDHYWSQKVLPSSIFNTTRNHLALFNVTTVWFKCLFSSSLLNELQHFKSFLMFHTLQFLCYQANQSISFWCAPGKFPYDIIHFSLFGTWHSSSQ